MIRIDIIEEKIDLYLLLLNINNCGVAPVISNVVKIKLKF